MGRPTSPLRTAPPELLDWIRRQRSAGLGVRRIYNQRADEFAALGVDYKALQNAVHQGFLSTIGKDTGDRTAQLGKIAELLHRSGVDVADIGKVDAVRLSEWQTITKNADGDAELHNLNGASIVLTPAWSDGPAWPVVQAARPTLVRPAKNPPRALLAAADGWKTAVVLPDPQFGHRRDLNTGELTTFHDPAALAVALQTIRLVRPDLVVLLGDVLDLAEFSRFEQEPEFANTTQLALDDTHLFLAAVRAEVPDAEIRYLEGNHDRRLAKLIVANAKAALRLRPAATPPTSWPNISIPAYLRLDELGIDYLGGYPANITWINERLACVHGEKVRSGGSTAAAVVDDERVSVLFGHVHRIEQRYKTRRTFHGARASFAATPGCLCRIDGSVPSTKGSSDPLGRPLVRPEDWQQGLAVVTYRDGDAPFALEQVYIHDGAAMFRGVPIIAEELAA